MVREAQSTKRSVRVEACDQRCCTENLTHVGKNKGQECTRSLKIREGEFLHKGRTLYQAARRSFDMLRSRY